MNYRHVSLIGTGKLFERVDAFLTIAEAGGSMQARLARQELSKLTNSEKIALESSHTWAFHERVNNALANAYGVCNEFRKKDAGEGMSYGCDIRITNTPPSRVWSGGSLYQFFWITRELAPKSGNFDPSRYVVVSLDRADSEVELSGNASDVAELFGRSIVTKIIPEWKIFEPARLDGDRVVSNGGFWHINMGQISKGRIVRMPRKKQVA